MTRWLRRVHMYVGLLNLSILLVFGIAGLAATYEVAHRGPRKPQRTDYVDFRAPANASDRQVADAVHDLLKFPLAHRIPDFALKRNARQQLELDFYSVNGMDRVTVLESENRLRIDRNRISLWNFFARIHAVNMNWNQPDPKLRLWAYYVEFSIWSLIFMSLTGVWLWLATRPALRWAQATFATGVLAFAVLWMVTR